MKKQTGVYHCSVNECIVEAAWRYLQRGFEIEVSGRFVMFGS